MAGAEDLSYCGISKEDVITSLYEATLAVRELMPYPATLKMLDRWEEDKPLASLSAASDTDSFIKALDQTGIKSWLKMLEPVFEYGALKDNNEDRKENSHDASRTEGKYLSVYKNLAQWGAFDYWLVKEDQRYYSADREREQEAFLATAYARALPEYLSPLNLSLSRQFNAKASGNKEDLASRWGLFMQFRAMAKDSKAMAMKVFDKFTPEDRRFISEVCYKMTGHDLQKQMIRHLSPFQIYGLAIEPGTEARNSKSHRQKCRPVLKSVKEFLSSEFANHWVRASAVGAITYNRQNIGPLLATTYPVAEKLAAQYPQYKTLARSGRQVGGSGDTSPKIW